MRIRPYEEKDKENVRHVCLVTAGCTEKPEEEKQFILSLYCDYYIEKEPENCFVVSDDDDNAVGYIMCAESFADYRRNFKPYAEKIEKISFIKKLFAYGEMLAHMPASKKCNAHMHIDILPAFQGKGIGSQLLSALTSHLKEKGVNGLMLVVSNSNKNAVKFYRKNGFCAFLNFGKGTLMTKVLL
ncbi:MAG: GNAT family N-acetyltransferase [Clostridia bacterium]|nr:GNAT family N-acetyltransferase [Clostridia bacterium]